MPAKGPPEAAKRKPSWRPKAVKIEQNGSKKACKGAFKNNMEKKGKKKRKKVVRAISGGARRREREVPIVAGGWFEDFKKPRKRKLKRGRGLSCLS